MQVLKMKISAPSLHFRIIHSNNPRRTFPLPPYSTVIGFLANILGEQEKINRMLSGQFAMGIISRYRYITNEYTWLRNLGKDSHRTRFAEINNRRWQENLEHPGGQSPITIEVLNDAEIYLYIYHSCPEVIDNLVENLSFPEKWLSHLHLGRAEDWVSVDSAAVIELPLSNRARDFADAADYFQWLPELKYAFGLEGKKMNEDYLALHKKIHGNPILVTSIYKTITVQYSGGQSKIRNFQQIPAKLFQCQIPFLDNYYLPDLYVDKELSTPVFMCGLNPESRGGC